MHIDGATSDWHWSTVAVIAVVRDLIAKGITFGETVEIAVDDLTILTALKPLIIFHSQVCDLEKAN